MQSPQYNIKAPQTNKSVSRQVSEGTVSQNLISIKENKTEITTIPEITAPIEEQELDDSPAAISKLADQIDNSKLDTLVPNGLISVGAPK